MCILAGAARCAPDLGGAGHHMMDPEDPDFSGVVDFSTATPGPDGSWCITKASRDLKTYLGRPLSFNRINKSTRWLTKLNFLG